MRITRAPAVLVLFLSFLPAVSGLSSERTDAARVNAMLKKGRASFDRLNSYTCVLDRTELIKGKYRKQNGLVVRFKKPTVIYIKFTNGPDSGTEALFDVMRYGGNMLVRKKAGKLFIRLRMNPLTLVRLGQERHAIYESDIGYIISLIEDHVKRMRSTGEGSLVWERDEKINGRMTSRFCGRFPENKGFYAGRIHINSDSETGLPIRLETYGWKDELLELYLFDNLVINPRLTDKDFEIGPEEAPATGHAAGD